MRLEGKCCVVVGVASRIGEACASAFAREGAEVLAVDPDGQAAQAVTDRIKAAGYTGSPFQAEYNRPGPQSVYSYCEQRWGRVDVLFNCTALLDYWEHGVFDEGWETVVKANLLGPVEYTIALRPLLQNAEASSVIYLSSIDGILGNPDFPAYSASKGGLIPLTHVMAHDHGAFGGRVNCIAMSGMVPVGTGPIPTVPAASFESTLRLTPLGRKPEPEDFASLALFFASDESSYVSGVVVPLDGGRSGITPGTGFAAP